MQPILTTLLLWLFVINLGVAFGAGIYESRIVVPHWIKSESDGYKWDAAAARRDNTGLRFWVFVTTVPLTLLTIANLIVAWFAPQVLRHWWIGAAVTAFADRIFTFSYFVPTMLKLMRSEGLSESQSVIMALQWTNLNYVRHAIVLAAWLLALKTFSLLYASSR